MKMKQHEKREKRNAKEKWCDFNLENYKKISFFFSSHHLFSQLCSRSTVTSIALEFVIFEKTK